MQLVELAHQDLQVHQEQQEQMEQPIEGAAAAVAQD